MWAFHCEKQLASRESGTSLTRWTVHEPVNGLLQSDEQDAENKKQLKRSTEEEVTGPGVLTSFHLVPLQTLAVTGKLHRAHHPNSTLLSLVFFVSHVSFTLSD